MLKLLNCTVYLEFLEPKIFKMGSLSSDSYDNLKAKLEHFYLRTVFLMPIERPFTKRPFSSQESEATQYTSRSILPSNLPNNHSLL